MNLVRKARNCSEYNEQRSSEVKHFPWEVLFVFGDWIALHRSHLVFNPIEIRIRMLIRSNLIIYTQPLNIVKIKRPERKIAIKAERQICDSGNGDPDSPVI
jgi:hypothetical protein